MRSLVKPSILDAFLSFVHLFSCALQKRFFFSNHQSLFTEFDKTCRDFIFLPNGCIVTCISVEQSKKNEYKSKGDFVIITCFTFKENFVCKHKYLILLSLIRSIASFFLSFFFLQMSRQAFCILFQGERERKGQFSIKTDCKSAVFGCCKSSN